MLAIAFMWAAASALFVGVVLYVAYRLNQDLKEVDRED